MSLMRTVRWTLPNVHLVIYSNIRATSGCAVSWPSARSLSLTGNYSMSFTAGCWSEPVMDFIAQMSLFLCVSVKYQLVLRCFS